MSRWPRWKRIGAKVVLSIAATVIALLAVEGLYRVFGTKPTLRGGWFLGTSYRALDDATIVIAPALRQAEHYRHRPGVPVVVVLGDSFTECFPLTGDDWNKCYVQLVGSELRAQGVDVDVIGVGQGETGSDQQIRLFENYVLPNVKPDLVIWEMYPNDVHEDLNYAAFAISPQHALVALDASDHWIHRRQTIWDWTPLPDGVKRWSYLYTSLLRATETTPSIPSRYRDWEAWSLDKIGLGLARMQDHADHTGFMLCPIVLEPGAAVAARTDPTWKANSVYRWYWEIRTIIQTAPGYIDTEFTDDDLARAAQHAGAEWSGSVYLGDRDPAPAGDKHYNTAGHWLLADKLVPAIRARLQSR